MSDESYAMCRECCGKLEGILDRRIRDYCQKCVDDLKLDAGLRRVPLMEVGNHANEDA
jgi:hypothetical protein